MLPFAMSDSESGEPLGWAVLLSGQAVMIFHPGDAEDHFGVTAPGEDWFGVCEWNLISLFFLHSTPYMFRQITDACQ